MCAGGVVVPFVVRWIRELNLRRFAPGHYFLSTPDTDTLARLGEVVLCEFQVTLQLLHLRLKCGYLLGSFSTAGREGFVGVFELVPKHFFQ